MTNLRDQPDDRATDEINRLIESFYTPSGDTGGVDWRDTLDGEELLLEVCAWGTLDAIIESITYVADGVRQVAPPLPFDPIRCASALDHALDALGDRRDHGRREH